MVMASSDGRVRGMNLPQAFTEYIKENAKLPFTLPEEDHLDDDDAPVGTVKDEL